MTDQDYVEFGNEAFALHEKAGRFFAAYSDEQIYQLNGLVRNEIAAVPGGKVAPAYDFLAIILAEEANERACPNRNVVQMPVRSNDVPF